MATKYYPSITTTILDKSETAIPDAFNDGSVLFSVITAPKGPVNKVVEVTSESQFIKLFGKPDPTKYGYQANMVVNWLRNGGTAFVLNVVSLDANIPNATLSVKKVGKGNDTEIKPSSATTWTATGGIVANGTAGVVGCIYSLQVAVAQMVNSMYVGQAVTLKAASEVNLCYIRNISLNTGGLAYTVTAELISTTSIPAAASITTISEAVGSVFYDTVNKLLYSRYTVSGNTLVLSGSPIAYTANSVTTILRIRNANAGIGSGSTTKVMAMYCPTDLTVGRTVNVTKICIPASAVLIDVLGSTTSSITDITSSSLKPSTNSSVTDNSNEYQLLSVYPNGRSTYYNNIGLNIALNQSLESTYTDIRLYNFELREKINSVETVLMDTVTGSFEESAMDEMGGTLYAETVIKKNLPNGFDINFNSDSYQNFCEMISLSSTGLSVSAAGRSLIDVITGSPRAIGASMATADDALLGNLYVVNSDAKSLYNPVTGTLNTMFMGSGSRGTLEGTNGDSISERNSLVQKAFDGLIDPTIDDTSAYPFDVTIDANYPFAVKPSISGLVDRRKDMIGILDFGTSTTDSDTLSKRKTGEMSNYNSFLTSLYTQYVTIFDDFSQKYIKVTSPYFLSTKIPEHDAIANNYHEALAGKNHGYIGSPDMKVSSIVNEEFKSNFAKYQVNYILSDRKGTRFATQMTSQYKNTALSNLPTVRSLLKLARTVSILVEDFQFELASRTGTFDASLELLKTTLNEEFKKNWIGKGFDTIDVSVEASETDRKLSNAKVTVTSVPKGYYQSFQIIQVVK
jgi:hypothetical protein